MLRNLLISLSLLCGLSLAAQETLTQSYFPAPGDTLRINVADSASAAGLDLQLAGGMDLDWDFSQIQLDFERSLPVRTPSTDSFPTATVEIENSFLLQEFYRVQEGQFQLVGAAARQALFPEIEVLNAFEPVQVERYSNVQVGDRFSSASSALVEIDFDSLPPEVLALLPDDLSLVDSIRIEARFDRTDEFDAYGTVRLLDNFYPALRQKRTERITTNLFAKLPFLGWQNVNALAIASLPEAGAILGKQPPVTTYSWWNDESKEPIAEATLDAQGQLTMMEYKRALEATSTEDRFTTGAEDQVYPNPAEDYVSYTVSSLPGGRYYLDVINVLGQPVYRRDFRVLGNQSSLHLDVTAFRSGQYFLRLTNERGRILATRRLMVR